MHLKSLSLGAVLLGAMLGPVAHSAEFIPFSRFSITAEPIPHWLDRGFQGKQCARLISGKFRWPYRSAFESPLKNFGFAMFLAEGASISNLNPFEAMLITPAPVLSKMGERIFSAYKKLPYLSVTEESEGRAQNWQKLFVQKDLEVGFSGVRTLVIPEAALPALSSSTLFPNVTTLIVEPSTADSLILVLESSGMVRLEHLSLNLTQLPLEQWQRLVSHPRFAKIKKLSLRMAGFGDEGMKILAASPYSRNITSFSYEVVSHSAVSNAPTLEGLKAFLHAPHRQAMKGLAFKSIWELGDHAVEELLGWPGLTDLESLELLDSHAEQAIAKVLKAHSFPRLRELRLKGTSYEDSLLEAISQNSSLTALERVTLDLHPDVSRDAVFATSTAPHLERTLIVYEIREPR